MIKTYKSCIAIPSTFSISVSMLSSTPHYTLSSVWVVPDNSTQCPSEILLNVDGSVFADSISSSRHLFLIAEIQRKRWRVQTPNLCFHRRKERKRNGICLMDGMVGNIAIW